MKQKDLTKTCMMISNEKVSQDLYIQKYFSVVRVKHVKWVITGLCVIKHKFFVSIHTYKLQTIIMYIYIKYIQ